MRKNFPFVFRTSLLQIYRLPLFLSLYTWSRVWLCLPFTPHRLPFFLEVEKPQFSHPFFPSNEPQWSCCLSTELIPIWQCVPCVRGSTTGHNTPDGLSQVLNIWRSSPPCSYWQQLGFFARRFQLMQHNTSAHFPWHCFLSNFYCSCGNFITEARLCSGLCRTSWLFCPPISPAWWGHSEPTAQWALHPVKCERVSLRQSSITPLR